jgi:hypothetical protein
MIRKIHIAYKETAMTLCGRGDIPDFDCIEVNDRIKINKKYICKTCLKVKKKRRANLTKV